MAELSDLARRLAALDGASYPAYKAIRGSHDAGDFILHIDHVQGDPFAEPSRFRAVVPPATAALPDWAVSTADRRRAAADFLNRGLAEALRAEGGTPGTGKSGELRILEPGQEVLARASMIIGSDGEVVTRFRVGLPARGRRILGPAAAGLVTEAVPAAIRSALRFTELDGAALRRHLEVVEDAVALRARLPELGLVAFVADGARLPRRSGIDDGPLDDAGVVPFISPEALRVSLPTPNSGTVEGLGIPRGVTLIVGGGYHGKSTLLRAIERGIHDHVPGDGRERVVAVPGAVKIRAEDGRRVEGVDISAFIRRLPSGDDTTRFRTENASGSTSQAAAIAEALEVGADCLLLDEDTSATNFMIRDARMQALIAEEHEPITPFIDRARQLRDEQGVSSILVVGGSGDYFDIADTVIALRDYRPRDVTSEARAVAAAYPTRRQGEAGPWSPPRPRVLEGSSVDAARGRREVAIRVRSVDRVEFGTGLVDVGGVEQLVEEAQTRAVAHAALRVAARDEGLPVRAALEGVLAELRSEGLETVHPHGIGELAEFRIFELAAFLNRLRTLRVRDTP